MNERDLMKIIKKELERYHFDDKVAKKKNSKKEIAFVGEDKVLREHLEDLFEIVEEAEEIVVSELGLQEFVEMSQGTYSTSMGKRLLYKILEGKKLILVTEGIEWRNFLSIPNPLQEKYREYEKRLESYGVKILKRIEVTEYLGGHKDCYNDKVLDLRKMKQKLCGNGGVLEVSDATIVTDLAREYAAVNNIKIIKR